jgi:CobQ-like glutamine amidotransferase family enzyme
MKKKLIIGWLYPDLMSIYGDRGNIIALSQRCTWRGIGVEVKEIGLFSHAKDMQTCDLFMMGGAQDRQQTIVAKDLQKKKKTLQAMIEEGTPGLYICGGFQYLGKYYKEADGTVLEQLGILDMYTENPGDRRLIGNIVVDASSFFGTTTMLVGFENHGGRTWLGLHMNPLGKVIAGYGSNDVEKTEGAVYKETIGTYLHGPILPKNPILADYLIQKALVKKYKREIVLESLPDYFAEKARKIILSKTLQ